MYGGMTTEEKLQGGVEEQAGSDSPPKVFPWLRVSLDDLVGFDFEEPVADSQSADSAELSELFRAAVGAAGQNAEPPDTRAVRIFSMLWAVTGMYFRSRQPSEPFGAAFIAPDGRRSALPADFRGPPFEVMTEMAERAKHLVLRARLADVCWLLDRKKGVLAGAAATAYVDIVKKVDAGALKFRFDKNDGALTYHARDLLQRALTIGRATGMDKSGPIAAREMVAGLRGRALERLLPIPTDWFGHLDLDFGISDPAEVGKAVEALIAALPESTDPHSIVNLWRLAKRAYHLAKKGEDKHRAQSGSAEQLVSMAERQPSAMLASHMLAEAIAELHGVPGRKERRRQLNHRLIDIQAGIADEMSAFSYPLDLEQVVKETKQRMDRPSLRDKLFIFAMLGDSPDPAQLIDRATTSIKERPLSSLFAVSHHDREGKIVHRSEGAGFGESDNQSAIERQIAQDESIRRQITAFGVIEVARQAIIGEHYIDENQFAYLLACSPFVPNDLVWTFSRGFVRFFQGDFVSALYILTPLLENSLRHVLKSHGHDVTKFDDAKLTQEDRTISSLFEQMRDELESIFGKAIIADTDRVFLKKPGPYLRHSLSHGLLHDGDPYGPDAIYGCWLIFRLCVLPLFPYCAQLILPFDLPAEDQTGRSASFASAAG